MAEILVKARDFVNPDSNKDTIGSFKRGMPVIVMEDGHQWGTEEGLPKFAIIKFPTVSISSVEKYIRPIYTQVTIDGQTIYQLTRKRRWRIRWEDLPTAAKNKLADTGQLIIKAGTYSGTFDYTWNQVKSYFRNLETGLDETDSL